MSEYENKVQTAMVESAAKAMDALGIMEANEAKRCSMAQVPARPGFRPMPS